MNGNGYNNNNPFEDNPFEEDKNDYLFQTVTNRGKRKTYSWSLAALICGILSLVFSCVIFAGLIAGVLAVLFSLISRKNLGYFEGMAITGLILGIIGTVIGASVLITLMTMSPEDLQKIIDSVNQSQQTPLSTPDL